jgi:hypothetical protein
LRRILSGKSRETEKAIGHAGWWTTGKQGVLSKVVRKHYEWYRRSVTERRVGCVFIVVDFGTPVLGVSNDIVRKT